MNEQPDLSSQQSPPPASETSSEGNVAEAQNHEPTKTLPSTRANLQSQLELLRAWAVASGESKSPASTPDVAKIAGRDGSTVSSCNGFFAEIGLLAKQGRSYVPAAEVFEFNRAHEWDKDKAPQKLAPVFRDSWAWESLGGRLSFKPLAEEEAITILAEACAAGPKYKGQLSSLLELLILCGLANRQDGGKIAKGAVEASHHNVAKPPEGGTAKPEAKTPPIPHHPASPAKRNIMTIAMDIEVSMDDVSALGSAEVTKFFTKWAELVNAKSAIEKMLSGDLVPEGDNREWKQHD